MSLQNPQATCLYDIYISPSSVTGREDRQAGISSQQQRRSPAAASRGVAGAWAGRAPCAERHLLCLMSRQSSTKSFQRRGVWRMQLLCPEMAPKVLVLQSPSVSPEIEMMRGRIREKADASFRFVTPRRFSTIRAEFSNLSFSELFVSLLISDLRDVFSCVSDST
jgi:hypothetical protein